jgi:glycosyltransferase involved in cell wall biosynthesis
MSTRVREKPLIDLRGPESSDFASAAIGSPNGAAVNRPRVRVDGQAFALGNRRLRIQGVTYGPFAPNAAGEPLPEIVRVATDFDRMCDAGINAIRTYHVPPGWLLDFADEKDMHVLIDVPWRKHLCFMDSAAARKEARNAVRQAAKRGTGHPSVFAYSIGNEIPTDVVRWHGARRVERFLGELADVCRQTDPDGLVTYASFPPTEYLIPPDLDFATFNVYLHDRATFRRYLLRLQNLVGDKPLLLGELGMDTRRHGESAQAEFLAGHVAEAQLLGLAGAFVFAWTDDWHTGGHQITDWEFGITRADRSPKASYHALHEVFDSNLTECRSETRWPRVSIVVCTYNGGRTVEQCLHSLEALEYPDYEVIVVDDGSTDETATILQRFPGVRAIEQPNRGLSVARNVGLSAANGEIVAYTDSDCFADPDWLTRLVYQLQQTGAAAVGGPNLTPEDGWLAACVAASPGQPSHVLESDQVAEHIPGCNMAFRREELLAINGFDPVYRAAGDDVDVCWRLQQAGRWITFAPGAFVWHHRRQGPRTYLRQQGGYGEAEALLRFKHPDKFNGRGDGKWRGVLYGPSLRGLRLGGSVIYRGTFGAGLFQCIYQPGPAHWAMLPSTLEWHGVAVLAALAALVLPWAGWIAATMLVLSVVVAALQAIQARLSPAHDGIGPRLVVAGLSYLQPLVRSWRRYRTRLFCWPGTPATAIVSGDAPTLGRPPLTGRWALNYWTEDWKNRTDLLQAAAAALAERRWGVAYDTGWEKWDLELHGHPWSHVRVRSVQEDHGGGKRLIRVAVRLRPSPVAAVSVGLVVASLAWLAFADGLAGQLVAATTGAALLTVATAIWSRGRRLASGVVAAFDTAATGLGMIRCDAETGRTSETHHD